MIVPHPPRQTWQKVLASLHWGDGVLWKNPPTGYVSWSKENTHQHEYAEVVVSLSGSHFYGINGNAIQLSPGSIALIPKGVPHDSWYSVYQPDCIDFWLHFLPHGAVLFNFVYHEPAGGPVLVRIPHLPTALQDDFRRVCFLFNDSGNASSTRKARHFLAYLLHELFEYLMESDLRSDASDERSVIEEVKRYAINHLTDRLTLPDLAKAAGYSPFHFHRLFLEAEGVTPRAFVESQRLRQACELLRKGQSTTSVALDVGFNTPSQFSKVFKKQFEMSPTQWLKTTMGA